jgi:hypothetical protein
MVDFLDRDRRSNLVLLSRFDLGIKPPRRPNFAQNMHTNKLCRCSLARPNRTTPEYQDVDHGVAVGQPWQFCVIEPIAFAGGMGGWCCWTSWCVVVFAVVLRSCAGYFLFILFLFFLNARTHEKRNTKTILCTLYVHMFKSAIFLSILNPT